MLLEEKKQKPVYIYIFLSGRCVPQPGTRDMRLTTSCFSKYKLLDYSAAVVFCFSLLFSPFSPVLHHNVLCITLIVNLLKQGVIKVLSFVRHTEISSTFWHLIGITTLPLKFYFDLIVWWFNQDLQFFASVLFLLALSYLFLYFC